MKKAFPVKSHLFALVVLTLYVAAGYFFKLGCPVFTFLGLPCPTCGGTRALLSLLRFDIGGYFSYHALALPLLAAVWLMIHQRLFQRKKAIFIFVCGVLILNTAYYAVRIYCFFAI